MIEDGRTEQIDPKFWYCFGMLAGINADIRGL